MSVRTVLVTGASGFVGSYCARHFGRSGWSVAGIDLKAPDVKHPAAPSFSSFEITDLSSVTRLSHLIQRLKPTVVVHAAGPANIEESFRDPRGDFAAQTMPWLTMLDGVREAAPEARLVLCSSAAIYGNPRELPVAETAAAAPISPYGYAKLVKELLLQEYVSIYSLRGSVARIFSTFGPGLRRLAVWEIARRTLAGNYHLEGTGHETRDYLYIEDVAAALYSIAVNGEGRAEAVNIGAGTEVKIREIAEMIGRQLGPGIHNYAANGESKPGKPGRWCADVSRLRTLGFSPSVSLVEGLEATTRWIASE